jgi:putative two-component system response regulator
MSAMNSLERAEEGGAAAPMGKSLSEDKLQRMAGAQILLVDDDPTVHAIVGKFCEQSRYAVSHAHDGAEALKMIQDSPPDLVLCDVRMPVMDGIELCRRLKSDPRTELLPVILLSALTSSHDQEAGLDAGADEYLTKPFRKTEGMARIRAMLRMKLLQDQLDKAEHVLFALARAVEARDHCTGGHIERVSSLVSEVGRAMGLDETVRRQLRRGAILHDIGKISTPDAILNKPGSLTPEEMEQVRRHPDTGEQICRGLKTLQPVLDLIRHHHERPDGHGYPDGLSGDAVTLPVRIMAACDAFDALTTDRPYRKALPWRETMALLEQGARVGAWDLDVLGCIETVTAR